MATRYSEIRIFAAILFCLLSALLLTNTVLAVDTWGIRNPSVQWRQGSEGMAMDGACYGMMLTAKMYHEMGLDKVRPFSEVVTPAASKNITSQAKELYLIQFAALAQNYALRNRNPVKDLYSLPSDQVTVDEGLSAASSSNPQILILTNHAAVSAGTAQRVLGHAVLVQGREEDDTSIKYKISDPNYPNTEREISYDKTTGAYTGLGGYDTLRHDNTTLPDQNAKWMEALLRGAAQPEGKAYLPVWRGNSDMPKTEIEYKKDTGKSIDTLEPPVPSPAVSNGISALKPDEVGGVRLYFDPAIVTDTEQTDARWEMVGELVSQITGGNNNFLLQMGGNRELHAVNLNAVLRQGSDLGGLTRVLGFARNRKTGEVYLLGKIEADTPAIPLDVLSVALQVIWKNKATPAVSLDPDAEDFYGPQHVRLEGFPSDYGNTEFTRIMLEADYAMKRIMLGEDRLDIDGYVPFVDIIAKHPEQLSGKYFRWWLYPKETSGASAYRIVRGDMDVFIYDSDVKLLTETMKRAHDGLSSTGQQDAMAEQGSLLFTSYYPQIERDRPVFRQLHGVFDVSKLAAVLRAEGASDQVFADIADRSVPRVKLKDSYEGIGPKLIPCDESTGTWAIFTGGGVMTAKPLREADFISLDGSHSSTAIDSLEQSQEDIISLSIDVPSNVALDPNNVRLADGDMESYRAMDEVMAGDAQSAISRLDRVLVTDPEHARAHTVRSIAYMAQGDYARALSDVDAALEQEPSLQAFRGRIRVAMGDEAGGLADVRAAFEKFPDRPDVLIQKALVEMIAMDLVNAQKDYERARVMMPLDPDLDLLGKQIRLLKVLGKSQGQALLKAQMAQPISTSLKLTRVMALSKQDKVTEAIELMEEVLKSVSHEKPDSNNSLYAEERCWVMLATLNFKMGTPEHTASARDYINRLGKKHPTWPSGVLFNLLDYNMPFKQTLQVFLKGARMADVGDPLLLDSRVRSGVSLKAQVGFQLAMEGAKQVDKDKTVTVAMVNSVIDQTIAACPPGPTRHTLGILKKSLAYHDLELKGKKFSKAENQRIDNEFRSAILNTPPVPPASDGINLAALKNTLALNLEQLCLSASTDTQYKDANSLFSMVVRGLKSDWAFAASLEEAAMENMEIHPVYAGMLANRVKKYTTLTDLMEKYSRGEIDSTDLISGYDQIAKHIADEQLDISDFSKILLRAELNIYSAEILMETNTGDLSREIALCNSRIAQEIENSAKGTIELKTAANWFTAQETALNQAAADHEDLRSILVDFHRRAERLNNRYAKEAALH
ncbi:MAG: tetratricopeptide repeat protein [Armatimonadota bacterium]